MIEGGKIVAVSMPPDKISFLGGWPRIHVGPCISDTDLQVQLADILRRGGKFGFGSPFNL